MELALLIIKPDAVEHGDVGACLSIVERKLLRIAHIAVLELKRETVDALYAAHVGQPYYAAHAEFMVSGPVVAAVLFGSGEVIRTLCAAVGDTDPDKAKYGTMRRLFGSKLPRNAVHASATAVDAEREVVLLFPDFFSAA